MGILATQELGAGVQHRSADAAGLEVTVGGAGGVLED